MIPTASESQSFQQGPSIRDLLAVNTSLVAPALAPDAILSLTEEEESSFGNNSLEQSCDSVRKFCHFALV